MPRALRVCPTQGCPELTEGGRCSGCKTRAEQVRGNATQRGYGHAHRTRFRAGVLRRDPLCVCADRQHGHSAPCLAPSLHADHHPLDRRELVARGMDPNDAAHGRGLCQVCHNKHSSQAQPGGWHAT